MTNEATRACVLLSGGFDSTAALHWALGCYSNLRALAFAYGQPHCDAELTMARGLAARLGVHFVRLALADALHTGTGIMGAIHDHEEALEVSAASVPGRNAAFLSLAAAHALTWWPDGDIALVVGACADDASGFPDCRPAFLAAMGTALSHGAARRVRVVAPFHDMTKADILASFANRPQAIDDIRCSWSCYRGRASGPCGTCTACVLRARAFDAHGINDASVHPRMNGSDPSRRRR